MEKRSFLKNQMEFWENSNCYIFYMIFWFGEIENFENTCALSPSKTASSFPLVGVVKIDFLGLSRTRTRTHEYFSGAQPYFVMYETFLYVLYVCIYSSI